MRQCLWVRCAVAFVIVAVAIGCSIIRAVPPTGIAVADCFQRGGYNPAPCTTTAPKAENNQGTKNPSGNNQSANQDGASSSDNSSANSQDASQDGSGSPDKDQSESTPGGSSPADSGINACQNQSAMANSLGLPPTTCRASQGPNTPPDSGMTACQNQSAMPIAIGLQPTTCPASQGPNSPPDSGVNACQNQNAMANSLGLQPAICPPSSRK